MLQIGLEKMKDRDKYSPNKWYIITWKQGGDMDATFPTCVVDIVEPESWFPDHEQYFDNNGNEFRLEPWYGLAVTEWLTKQEFEKKYNVEVPYP